MRELARLRCELAEERTKLRAAALVVAYSTAVFVLGTGIPTGVFLGIVLMSVSACGMLFGGGWAIRYGMRAAKYSRQLRAMTQLPSARLLDR